MRSLSCMYTDFLFVSFNSSPFYFFLRFLSSCALFYYVVCVAAVICFGCACQPCCVVLWELQPASIVSISSSLPPLPPPDTTDILSAVLSLPRPTIPWSPPGTPRIPSGRYWLSSPTPRSWSSIPQGATTVCGVPTASRAVTNSTRTSSLAGSPWGVSLPRNTRSALLWAMLPDVLSFAVSFINALLKNCSVNRAVGSQ